MGVDWRRGGIERTCGGGWRLGRWRYWERVSLIILFCGIAGLEPEFRRELTSIGMGKYTHTRRDEMYALSSASGAEVPQEARGGYRPTRVLPWDWEF